MRKSRRVQYFLIIVFLATLFFGVGAVNGAEEKVEPVARELKLRLNYQNFENSKDSHRSDYVVAIDGRKMTYSFSSAGYRYDNPPESKKLDLTDEEYNQILGVIDTNQLMRQVNDIQGVDGVGDGVEFLLTLSLDGKRVESIVRGMFNIWGDRVSKTNITELKYQKGVAALLEILKKIAKR